MMGLLVSDLHYALKQFDWVCNVADRFDLVVIAGDHLDISSLVAIDAQIVVLRKYFSRIRARGRLVVCSGNHDLTGRNDAGERVATWLAANRLPGIATDGGFFDLDDTSVTICPWWDGPASRLEVDRQLGRDAARRAARWIWVYHAPPDQSPVSWAGDKHFGDVDLLRWIRAYEPDIVLSGHIHQSPFRKGGSWVDRIGKTWVFNAGRQIGPSPTHIIFDTRAQEAMWYSLAGDETVRLDAPQAHPVPAVNLP